MTKRTRNIIIGVVIVVVVAIIGWFSFGGSTSKASNKTVTIGIMSGAKQDEEIWNVVSKTAKDKYGITLKFDYFTDYNQPNIQLVSGKIDLNAFQSFNYVNDWNKKNNTDIVSVGSTYITPMHVFSKTVKSISDIPNGGTIAIPNDAANESRALNVLQSAGLIKLNTDANQLANLQNITSNDKNIQFKEVDASLTAQALSSVSASVVNQNYFEAANLPKSESIYAEPLTASSAQFVNFIAADKKNADNKLYKDVAKAYADPATEAEIKKVYPDGSMLAAWNKKF